MLKTSVRTGKGAAVLKSLHNQGRVLRCHLAIHFRHLLLQLKQPTTVQSSWRLQLVLSLVLLLLVAT